MTKINVFRALVNVKIKTGHGFYLPLQADPTTPLAKKRSHERIFPVSYRNISNLKRRRKSFRTRYREKHLKLENGTFQKKKKGPGTTGSVGS